MENFNFGKIPVHINNNYSDIEKARTSREVHLPQALIANSIECLSSFYREASKVLSPERKQKINKLLIDLAITTLSGSSLDHHLSERESVSSPTPNSNYSFKMGEAPQPNIGETKITLSPIEIKNEPPSKITQTLSTDAPKKESLAETVKDASIEKWQEWLRKYMYSQKY